MRISAIVPAAGKGRRFQSKVAKALFPVMGLPLLVHTLKRLRKAYAFHEIIVAAAPDQMAVVQDALRKYGLSSVRCVRGGSTRAESVKRALADVSEECDWVLTHDAARPLIDASLVKKTVEAAGRTGGAICGLAPSSTVKKIKRGWIAGTENRDSLFLAQTPQVFRKTLLWRRYRALGKKAMRCTDEAALFDGTRMRIAAVPGRTCNIKVTTPEDIDLLKYYLKK